MGTYSLNVEEAPLRQGSEKVWGVTSEVRTAGWELWISYHFFFRCYSIWCYFCWGNTVISGISQQLCSSFLTLSNLIPPSFLSSASSPILGTLMWSPPGPSRALSSSNSSALEELGPWQGHPSRISQRNWDLLRQRNCPDSVVLKVQVWGAGMKVLNNLHGRDSSFTDSAGQGTDTKKSATISAQRKVSDLWHYFLYLKCIKFHWLKIKNCKHLKNHSLVSYKLNMLSPAGG